MLLVMAGCRVFHTLAVLGKNDFRYYITQNVTGCDEYLVIT